MLIRGEVLIETVTLSFAVSGKRGEWKVTVTSAPGGATSEDETSETSWFALWNELIADAYSKACNRRFPDRIRAQARP